MTLRGTILCVTMLLASVFGYSTSAHAQDVGVRAGVSGDPDQFYFGAHLYTAPVVEALRFRPNLEVGVGDDFTLTTVNLEFVYPLAIGRTPWRLLPGAGPALNIANYRGDTDMNPGFNILLGVEHRGGLFVELKIGAIDSPEVKFGVGYTFGRR